MSQAEERSKLINQLKLDGKRQAEVLLEGRSERESVGKPVHSLRNTLHYISYCTLELAHAQLRKAHEVLKQDQKR